jgi:hypothetical protein
LPAALRPTACASGVALRDAISLIVSSLIAIHLIFGLKGLLLTFRLLILSVTVADEWIQGTVVIEPQRGIGEKYFVSFYPASPDHRPCVKSDKGLCFARSFSESDLLDAFREAETWLKYTLLDELAAKPFMCVIRTSVHDRLLQS